MMWSSLRKASKNNENPEIEELEAEIIENALSFARRTPARHGDAQLQRPVRIPRLESRAGAPFARLYAHELWHFDVPMNEFIEFIDNMNIVCTEFAPLQILDVVGSFVGMVPYHWAQLAGTIVSLGSKANVYALSKIRGETFLRRANAEYFNPRGLNVQMCTTDALVRLGHIPIEAEIIPALNYETAVMSIEERRLSGMMPWLSPLTDKVPPPAPQTNKLKAISNKQAERASKKAQHKAMKNRIHAFEKQGLASGVADQMFATLRSKGEFTPRQIEKMEKDFAKGEREREKEQREYGQERAKIEREAEKEIGKAYRKGKMDDVQKAERERIQELTKLDREYDKEQLKHKQSFEKEDKERKKGHKAAWLLIHKL